MDIDLSISNSCLKIDLSKISSNYRKILGCFSGNVIPACVLKSNAYGIGIEYVAPIVIKEGCRNIFVTYLDEAKQIKNIAKKLNVEDVNIFVLSPGLEKNSDEIINNNFIPILRTLNHIQLWIDCSKKRNLKLPCVIKFDTGMNRFGIKKYETNDLLSLNIFEFLDIKYIMSHLSSANYLESNTNHDQLNGMKEIADIFKGIPVTFGNSYSIFFDSSFHFDMIRIGRLLYGESDAMLNNQIYPDIGLEPVFSIYSHIMQIKDLKKGESVGYGATYVAQEDVKIAIVGIGYSEGYNSRCKDNFWFIINGKVANIIGTISMEYTVCDISDIKDVKEGDIVTVIGEHASIDQMAGKINVGSLELINYFFSTIKNKIYFDLNGKRIL